MSTEDIRSYSNMLMPDIDEEIAHLIAFSDRLSKMPVSAPELNRLLDEIEAVIVVLQNVYDRCCQRFPDAEADGTPDPHLAHLRDLINGWHTSWEGWKAVGVAAISASAK